jgi:hypothetical protein
MAAQAPTSTPAMTSVGQCQPTVTREAAAASPTMPIPNHATTRSAGQRAPIIAATSRQKYVARIE